MLILLRENRFPSYRRHAGLRLKLLQKIEVSNTIAPPHILIRIYEKKEQPEEQDHWWKLFAIISIFFSGAITSYIDQYW